MCKRALTLLMALAFAGCAHGPKGDEAVQVGLTATTGAIEAQRDALVGKWFRSQSANDGGTTQEIVEINRNGTYVFRIRRVHAQRDEEQWSEIGEWGIVGDIHFTITKGWLKNDKFEPADPNLAKHYHVYKVLTLTAEEFAYRHSVTNNKFILRKVSNDFQFPN